MTVALVMLERIKFFARISSLFFLLFFCFVALIGELSGIGSHIHQVVSEFPLALVLFLLVYFSVQSERSNTYKFIVSLIFILYIYILYDVYYVYFGRYFLLVDFLSISSLLEIMPGIYAVLLSVFFLVPLFFFVWVVWKKIYIFIVFLISTFLLLFFSPKLVIDYFQYIYPGVFYEHAVVMDNGRFASLLYFEAKRRIVLDELENFDFDYEDNSYILNEKKPDIFVLVLESYIDPHYFSLGTVVASEEPFFFSASRSPVFGGGTARAEFEVLCGVPSYARYESNEFNLMSNDNIPCFPKLLSDQGYRTIALNPYKPNYFNALRAYKGIGFQETHFHPKFYHQKSCIKHDYPSSGFYRNEWLFDDLSECIDAKFYSDERPVFSYIMTTYGHSPFELPEGLNNAYGDYGLEPDFSRALTMGKQVNDTLVWLHERLIGRQRDYLLVVVGDHLPTFFSGQKNYNNYKYNDIYKTPLAIYRNGSPISIPDNITHFELINYALCQIDHDDCRSKIIRNEQDLLHRYQAIMKQSVFKK